MATQTTDQQNALKDAMARAKQIAAKLAQQATAMPTDGATPDKEESRKRSFPDSFNPMGTEAKRTSYDLPNQGVDHTDPKVIAQQVANSLVQRAGLGSMLVEEVTVPNKLVGLVIGRGGEMINKLQSDSGAKIQVAPDPPPDMAHLIEERQITITGTTDAVNKAKSLIQEIRTEGKVPERLVMSGNTPGEYSTDMMIAASKVGLIIGKGGETIKSLQERAGCKMVLFQDGEYANAPEKPLRISGEQSKVLYGKQLIQDLLTSKELESIDPNKKRQDGGNYEEIQVPREAVGFVIGAKGASINMIQQQTGCRVQFKNDMEGDFKIAMLTGTPQEVAMAKAKLNEILQSHQERRGGNWSSGSRGGPRPSWGQQGGHFNGGGPRPNWGGHQGGGTRWGSPGPRGGNQQQGSLPPGHKHMVIHVPANKCGLVIGKGGETLKHIHNETQVNIEINREVPELSPFRVFHLRGTEEQIEKATEIIREKIGDPSVIAKPADESQGGNTGQNQWGGDNAGGWGGSQNQQWSGQPGGWGQQPSQDQWNQQGWNQQQGGAWNQQPGAAQPWDQQQQWQQPQQNQWQNQQFQQWGQPVTSGAPTTPATDPSQAGQPAGGQPDYSAAWAAYYQQQSQYYQQYAMQQQQPGSTATSNATDPNAASAAVAQTPGTPSTGTTQAQSMAEYQAKLAEYYKSFGQQPPQPQQ